jgi:AcrR family transcriptional regulator
VSDAPGSPRSNQRLRTRKDLLSAAGRLLKQRQTFTMEELAREAMVSRATAYRYFPNLEALLVEAPLDGAVPDPGVLFADDPSADPVERLDRAEEALHHMMYRNEAQLRALMVHSLRQWLADGEHQVPVRQNRRTPLIEAALAPVRDRLDDVTYARLSSALALVFGPESMLVFRDVVPLSETEARQVKSWALRALVQTALAGSGGEDNGRSGGRRGAGH